MSEPLIELRGLAIGFDDRRGRPVEIVRGLDLTVARSETLGVVGESGCGKSTVLLAMLGYLKPGLRRLAGGAHYRGADLFALAPAQLSSLRGGKIGFVPQNAAQSLTPTLRVKQLLAEALALHSSVPRSGWRGRMLELLRAVRFPEPAAMLERYPHELSGGQQQRIAIAMALAGEPELLLLDEPTTALDVTTRAHVLDVLRELRASHRIAMVYVSHDLGVIAHVADRIAVMYAGEVVEQGPTAEVLGSPAHPYTHGLLRSIPRLRDRAPPVAMPGQPPAFGHGREGCAFAERCALVEPRCRATHPDISVMSDSRAVRCYRAAATPTLDALGSAAASTPARVAQRGPPLLQAEHLAITYQHPDLIDRVLGLAAAPAVVPDLDLSVGRGQVLSLVGESGSGKSTILRVVAGLWPALSGRVLFDGAADASRLAQYRSADLLKFIQIVFQNPDDSLNPRHTVAEILASPLRLYFGLGGDELRQRSLDLLRTVRLGEQHIDRFPAQLSGGEKQRVAIARGFAAEPRLLLCDEVTSALDVSVQAAVIDLLIQLKSERDVTLLFVSHDLAVVRVISDRVAILYHGELVEHGTVDEVYAPPFHPYTEALLSAVLEPEVDSAHQIILNDAAAGKPTRTGCPFATRCPRRLGPICDDTPPPWRAGAGAHALRCHISVENLSVAQTESSAAARARA